VTFSVCRRESLRTSTASAVNSLDRRSSPAAFESMRETSAVQLAPFAVRSLITLSLSPRIKTIHSTHLFSLLCVRNLGDDAERLATCRFEGKTYRAGERMYSSVHKCHQCLCTADFVNVKNMTANKDCFKVNCNIELREVENIGNECVPVYHSGVCCPYDWRCPHRYDAIVPGNERQEKTSPKCKFGNLEFNVGDRLSVRETECSNCTCLVPPMLSCTYSHECRMLSK
jgi:hypothetical protein